MWIPTIREGEDVLEYIHRVRGYHDDTLYEAILGAAGANEPKGCDEALGMHAVDKRTRLNARTLLANTMIGDLVIGDLRTQSLHEDAALCVEDIVDCDAFTTIDAWTIGNLRDYLLGRAGRDQTGHEHPAKGCHRHGRHALRR